jgi:uncharacterized protein YabE (DUF348 family)
VGIGAVVVALAAAAGLRSLQREDSTTGSPLIVVLQSDGPIQQIQTHLTQPLAVLEDLGIVLGPYDRLEIDGQEFSLQEVAQQRWDDPVSAIHIKRSRTVTLKESDQTRTLHTTKTDVGRVLDEAGVSLYLADRVMPALSTLISDGLMIEITRSMPLTVIVDERQLSTRAVGPTVGGALAEIGIAPVGLDYTLPELETPLAPGMMIEIVRVFETPGIYGKPTP